MPERRDFNKLIEGEEKRRSQVDFNALLEQRTLESTARLLSQVDIPATGLNDARVRLALSAADTQDEKRQAFKKFFPQGSFFRIPATGRLVFKRNPSEPFQFVEGEGFEGLPDIADFLGDDLGAIVGETLAFALTKNPTSGRVLSQAGKAAIGAVAGDVGQQTIEDVAGINVEDLTGVGARSAVKGLSSGAFAPIGSAAASVVNAARGSGLLSLTREAQIAQEAMTRLAPQTPLTPSQVSNNPVIQKLEQQSAQTVDAFRNYYASQARAIQQGAIDRVGVSNLATLRADLTKTFNRIERDLLAGPTTSFTRAGGALQSGLRRADDVMRTSVDEAYNVARSIGDPQFDLSPAQGTASEILGTFRAAAAEGGTINVRNLDPELARIAKTITDLDPSLPQVEGTQPPFEVLKELRSQLSDLSTPNPGERFTNQNRLAKDLFKAVDEVLHNPVSADPRFVSAWQNANALARRRFKILEKDAIRRVSRSETPTKLAAQFAQPLEADNLRLLKSVIPTRNYQQLQQAFRGNLLRDPANIARRLDEFDDVTLSLLMSPTDQAGLRAVGQRFAQLQQSGIQEALRQQSRNTQLVAQLIERNDSAGLQQLRQIANTDKQARDSLRAGVLHVTTRKFFRMAREGAQLSDKAIEQEINNLVNSGAARLLNSSDIRFLKDVGKVAPRIAKVADPGTSIQAAETAAGIRGLEIGAIVTFFENLGLSKLYLSNTGRNLLIGAGRKQLPSAPFQSLAGALGIVAEDIRQPDEPPN